MPGLNEVYRQRVVLDGDVVLVRQAGRRIAEQIGFTRSEQALIATAISELARNIVKYAGEGEVEIAAVHNGVRTGLQVIARDSGPGIDDIDAAMTDGFSTGASLGLGLPGTRRIMDDFALVSPPGQGVTVTTVKWAGA